MIIALVFVLCRVIRLQNGLTAILISDLSRIPVCEEDEDGDNEGLFSLLWNFY